MSLVSLGTRPLNIANRPVLDTTFQATVEVVNERVTGLLGPSWTHCHRPGTITPCRRRERISHGVAQSYPEEKGGNTQSHVSEC